MTAMTGVGTELDPVEKRLQGLLVMVNDWLKFAEAKNAGLVGLSAAGVGLGLSTLARIDGTILRVGLAVGEVLLVLSLLVGLGSFFPRTSLARVLTKKPRSPRDDDNLYFYAHLAKYAPRDLAVLVASAYARADPAGAEPARSHVDLAAQVVVNSRITMAKLELFAIAAVLFGAAIVALAASAILAVLL